MKIDPKKANCTPLIAGHDYMSYYADYYASNPDADPEYGYGISNEYIMQYLTDADAAAKLIPEPYKLGERPIVTVLFTWFKKTYVSLGGEYALSAVGLNARFDGERDHEDGIYNLVMPETNNWPTLMGRDCSGTGKIFAHIPYPYEKQNGNIIAETQSWNIEDNHGEWKTFYGIEFGPMKECNEKEMQQWEDAINALPNFVYKVITNGTELEISKPVKYGFKRKLSKCWAGKEAKFYLGEELNKSMIIENRCIEAFKTLPVLEVLGVAHYHAKVGDNLQFITPYGSNLK